MRLYSFEDFKQSADYADYTDSRRRSNGEEAINGKVHSELDDLFIDVSLAP
ncbi:MAG: hypothetical protein ABR556_13320 [Pyrinomonadaceae bacterium]